jgi:hypothetical protein
MDRKILALLATMALVAVGCESIDGSDSSAGGQPVGSTVEAMSADADVNTVRVADNVASVKINEFTYDELGDVDTYSFTFNLPDGTSATFTDADIGSESEEAIGPWGGLLLIGENADFDWVEVLIGFGVGDFATEQEWVENSLFTLARVDPDGDEWFGYDTYMVAGDETGTLPAGSAEYYGVVIATIYEDGEYVDENLFGEVLVGADFDGETVDILLEGGGAGGFFSLEGTDLAIDGSGYSGQIDGTALTINETVSEMSGDVLGAFFGDDAEATAGVFGVESSGQDAIDGDDVEIVGGFAAYDSTLD